MSLRLSGRPIHAVLFDMDGTLVASHASVERAWATWSVEHGLDPAGVLPHVHGSPADRTVRRLLPHLDDAAVATSARRQLELQYDDLDGIEATDGAHELLALLDRKEVPWAVVTSADRRLAAVRLGAARIRPRVLVTVEDVDRGKPAPDGYLAAARALGVAPADALVVEDADVGVAAGRAAGMFVVAIAPAEADLTVAGLTELLTLLQGAAG